jgi:hypothetical protein
MKGEFMSADTLAKTGAPAFCRNCGQPLGSSGKFCSKCGSEVSAVIDATVGGRATMPLQGGISPLEQAVADHPEDESYRKLLAVALHDDAMKDWVEDPEDKNLLCTSRQGINHARNQLTRANSLQFDDPTLREHIGRSLRLVDSMEERKFAGYWLMVVVLGFFYIIPGVIWWYVNRRPLYLLNRDYMAHVQTGKHQTAAAKMGGLQGKIYDFFESIGGSWGWLLGLFFMLTIGIVLSPIFMFLAYKQNYMDTKNQLG